MRRHTIVGRFGPLDRTDISVSHGDVVTRLNLIASNRRLEYGISNAIDDLARLSVFPSEIGLDILILAAHVHAADTRISRTTESQDTWTREIRLVVPVSDPDRWMTAAPVLKRMLDFLTGDRWTIGFRPRPQGFAQISSMPFRLRANTQFSNPALFSGGLDSLIGAIDAISRNETPLFISHSGEGATSDAQNSCYEALKRHYDHSYFSRLRVWMSFPEGLIRGVESESTTRGRSFLFIALGIFAGAGLNKEFILNVPENGLIALNVPLDPMRLGSLSTRTTHPFYLARWNQLLEVLGIPGHIRNPYWNETKGEMVEACANQELLSGLIPSSLSCSSPAKARWKKRGIEHCGYCLPCLIRRAAILKGLGHGADRTSYTLSDLSAQILDTHQAEGQQVRSFQFAIRRIQTRPALARLLIHKPGPLSDESAERIEGLASVYQRGMEEVASLLNGVASRPL